MLCGSWLKCFFTPTFTLWFSFSYKNTILCNNLGMQQLFCIIIDGILINLYHQRMITKFKKKKPDKEAMWNTCLIKFGIFSRVVLSKVPELVTSPLKN